MKRKELQEAVAQVEARMEEHMLQYTPLSDIRICDLKQISHWAKNEAFRALEKHIEENSI